MHFSYCKAILSGIEINYAFRFPDTINYLGKSVTEENLKESDNCVSLSDYEIKEWEKLGKELNGFAEYSLLHLPTSTYLLNYNRFIFHSVAFILDKKAWLITALPGVGKSTQFNNLMYLHPDEISIINGDKPILELKDDNSFMVHPSPWNGKEKWSGAESAPLAGVICLKQEKNNSIQRIGPKDSAVQVFISIHHTYENKQLVQQAGTMASKIIKSVPIWLLSNKGDLESSELVYQTIKQWDKEHNHEV